MILENIIQNMLKRQDLRCPKEVIDLEDGKLRNFTLACVCQGISKSTTSNILKPKLIETFQYKAKINATLYLDGRYTYFYTCTRIDTDIELEKNDFLRCNRKNDLDEKKQFEIEDNTTMCLKVLNLS